MNNSITPIDPDDQATERAFATYFRNDDSVHIKDIKPFIKEAIKEKREATPPLQSDTIIDRLENGSLNITSEDLNEIVIKAMDKAFEHHRLESKKKWSKMQAASLTAGATLISSGITLTIFLLHYHCNN